MKKLMFLFVSLLTLTMTSCGDDEDEPTPVLPVIDEYSNPSPVLTVIPAEGGTVAISWPTIYDNWTFYTTTWSVREGHEEDYKEKISEDPGNWLLVMDSEAPRCEIEVEREGNVMTGEWFTAESYSTGTMHMGTKEVPSGMWTKVTLSANTTGTKRSLTIITGRSDIGAAYIFQDCTETEEN